MDTFKCRDSRSINGFRCDMWKLDEEDEEDRGEIFEHIGPYCILEKGQESGNGNYVPIKGSLF